MSAVGVFELGEDGTLPGGPIQTIFPTSNKTGPIASRQDRSYSHEVIIDPTNTYVLVPDLGADLVRVFTYAPDTIAPLVETTPLTADAGAGPRHGFFRVNDAGETFFFFGGELSQVVYSYRVTYGDSGLTFDKVFEAPALGLNSTLPANTAPVSECAITVCLHATAERNEAQQMLTSSWIAGPEVSDRLNPRAVLLNLCALPVRSV